jgi:transcriptional regulator with XRE-family HTH domain
MEKKVFWGEHGEYGPFTSQNDGWPNAGEVIRHYRRKRKMSAERLAKLYREELTKREGHAPKTSLTARWILKMEQKNQIPADLTRRRILAEILDIPPLLLGLASLEAVKPHLIPQIQTSPVLTYSSLDLEWHEREARTLWQLHYAQTAHDVLPDLLAYIDTLTPIQQTAKGNLAQHLSELLNSYCRLAATIQRDRGNFEQAYILANESVRLAKAIGTHPYALRILAASQYTRGVVHFAWGVFGHHTKQGKIIFNGEKIAAALADFERALVHASPQLKGIIYSEMARAKALIATSPTDISIAQTLMEQAEAYIDTDNRDDFYTQILLHGDVKGLDKKRLILGRAKAFLAMKRPAKALEEFDDLEMLYEGKNHARRRGWTSVLYAQAAFELGDYSTATDKAISAFLECQEVHSIVHLARLNELYRQLLASPHNAQGKVKRLGRMLNTLFPGK